MTSIDTTSSSRPGTSATCNNYAPTQKYDIVAHISHNRISDVQKATFKRHGSYARPTECTYSIDLPGERNDNIVFLGKEIDTSELGYDYLIAVVNKNNGLVDYVPAKLVNFEKMFTSDPNLMLGVKPPPKVDYSVDNALTKETLAEKRRALTAEFGSAKKMKLQESASRRQIKDETLKSMMDSSALFSPETDKSKAEMAKPISLLVKATSAVLPKANENAKSPQSVYSFNLFFSEEEITGLKKSTLEFLEKPKKELVNAGFPNVVFALAGSLQNNGERAVFTTLLAAMTSCYKLVGKFSKHAISEIEWNSLPYPSEFLNKIRELFFAGSFSEGYSRRSKGLRKLFINSAEKDKLLSHLICLALLLDKESMQLSVTPWAKALECTEGKLSKIATALGCKVTAASAADAVRLGTIHVARLIGPPPTKLGRKVFHK